MKNTILLAFLVFFLTPFCSQAQDNEFYHSPRTAFAVAGATNSDFTGYSGTGANINVVYNRINWTIDPRSASNTITGTVAIYFTTIAANAVNAAIAKPTGLAISIASNAAAAANAISSALVNANNATTEA